MSTLPAFAAVLIILAVVLCAASLATRESWAKALFVLALILLAWTVVDGQEPLPPPVPPPPGQPCAENPAAYCTPVTMTIEGALRSFTAQDLGGRPPESITETAVCTGRWTKGALRYYVDGTAPSALVGTLVPYPVQVREEQGQPATDPENTLEDSGTVIRLYNRAQIVNFKAVWANWGGAEIAWECQL